MYFSIIVPVYNAENYLYECVKSVLSQSFLDFELILVDDGSTDKSGKLCDEFAAEDDRIIVIHKTNGGQSTARNQGVDIAKGKYLVFLDSDDFINDNSFLESLYRSSTSGVDIVVYRYLKYFSDHTSDCGIKMGGLFENSKIELVGELVRRDAFFCSCWSKIVKAELIKQNGIRFDESLSCEDMDWYFNVILKARTISVIDQPFISYRQREGSVTSSGYKEKNLLDYVMTIDSWEKRFSEIHDEKERKVMMSALAKLYCNLLISFSRNYRQAKEHSNEVYSFKGLLKWDINPRTRLFHSISSVVGVRGLCVILRLLNVVHG